MQQFVYESDTALNLNNTEELLRGSDRFIVGDWTDRDLLPLWLKGTHDKTSRSKPTITIQLTKTGKLIVIAIDRQSSDHIAEEIESLLIPLQGNRRPRLKFTTANLSLDQRVERVQDNNLVTEKNYRHLEPLVQAAKMKGWISASTHMGKGSKKLSEPDP